MDFILSKLKLIAEDSSGHQGQVLITMLVMLLIWGAVELIRKLTGRGNIGKTGQNFSAPDLW